MGKIELKNKKYTYADYITWPEDERWEIIDGVPCMQVAPTWQHQAISTGLTSQFYAYFKGKPCRVFAAPFVFPELTIDLASVFDIAE